MIHVVALAAADRRLLRERWAQHGNSHRRMTEVLQQQGADDALARLNALRQVEKLYNLDLAEICHRHARRNDALTHPIERLVIEFITEERHHEHDAQLWVLTDRVKQVRELMDGKFGSELQS